MYTTFIVAGFLPADWNNVRLLLGISGLTAAVIFLEFFIPDGDLIEKYPVVRSDALLLPNTIWLVGRLSWTVPWDEMKDLIIEHPKRETGPKWEAGGPDLRITVTTGEGRVIKVSYDGAQDIPWVIHDPLVAALRNAWDSRKEL